jgi:hypothetical protein
MESGNAGWFTLFIPLCNLTLSKHPHPPLVLNLYSTVYEPVSLTLHTHVEIHLDHIPQSDNSWDQKNLSS